MRLSQVFKKMIRNMSLMLSVFGFVLSGCSSTTLIRSSDPESRIYVDGEFKGTGQVTHTDAKTTGSVTQVRIEKEGCAPQNFTFKRNEKLDIAACITGVLIVPLFWLKKYNPEREFEYSCTK